MACRLAAAAGLEAIDWQRDMLDDWGARTPDGMRYLHSKIGGSIPRQTGKSTGGIAWTMFRAVAEGAVCLWTDHNYSTTCEMLRRFREIFGKRPNDPDAKHPEFNRLLVDVSSKTAQEAMFFERGGSIHFATRTKSSSLGYSFDLVVYDEAQELTYEHQQAISPTTTSGKLHDLQLIYLGTPTRPTSFGDVFAAERKAVLAGESPDMCWWEWGIDEVGDIYDESRWYEVNPSLKDDGGVADIYALRAALPPTNTELAFAQEYLGYWLPGIKQKAEPLIGEGLWDAAAVADAPAGEPSAFGVKFSSDGSRVCLSVCVIDGEQAYVELVDDRSTTHGTKWLVAAVARKGADIPFVVDGKSGARNLIDRVLAANPECMVSAVSTENAIAAASGFVNELREGTLVHIGKTEDGDALSISAARSTKRNIGSNGGFGFGGEASTPVESAALAAWAARQREAEEPEDDMEVYF